MGNSAPHLGGIDVLLTWRKQRHLLKLQSSLAETSTLPQHTTCQFGGLIGEQNLASQNYLLFIWFSSSLVVEVKTEGVKRKAIFKI